MVNSDCKPDRSFNESRKAATMMNQLPQTGKRIVSKRTYATYLGVKYLLSCLSIAALAYGVWCMINLVRLIIRRPDGIPLLLVMVPVCMLGALLIFTAVFLVKTVKRIDPVIPLTRANTSDLPAPESLVRGSEEPVQEQKTMLLRAATHRQETPLEQLVRPASSSE